MAQLGISPNAIYTSLSGQNLVTPAGRVEVGRLHLRIQPTGEFTSVEDIGDLLILQEDDSVTKLYLKDIATISRGYAEPPSRIVHFNGQNAIGLGISTVEGGNVVKMGEAIRKRGRELDSQVVAVDVILVMDGIVDSHGQRQCFVVGVKKRNYKEVIVGPVRYGFIDRDTGIRRWQERYFACGVRINCKRAL